MNATYYINKELNGIEIVFPDVPAPYIRNLLKGAGFAWHHVKGLWYAKQSPERLKLVQTLAEQSKLDAKAEQKTSKAPTLAPLWERVRVSDLPAYGTENTMKEEIKATCKVKGWGYDRACADYFRKHLKARFPECRFSVTSGGAGWLQNCEIRIKASPYDRPHVDADPTSEDWRKRFGHYELSPELAAILAYCEALHKAADADDGNYYADYGAHHDLYGNAEITDDYTQTEQTDAIRDDVKAFRAAKEEAEKAEKTAEEKRIAEELARREIERKEEEERERRNAERAAQIEDTIEVVDYYEGEQLAFTELLGGSGKEASRDELRETIANHGNEARRETAVVSRRVIFKSASDLGFFESNFLRDWSFLVGKGGTKTADIRVTDENYHKLSAEQRETVSVYMVDCVAVYLFDKLMYIVDPEGYSYARYMYIPSEETRVTSAAEFERKEEEESAEKEPLYIPAPLSEQIKAAAMTPGEPVTVITSTDFCGVSAVSGKLLDLAPCQYAQYKDAARLDMIPPGKRKGGRMYLHTGKPSIIYRGILPPIPESLKYSDISERNGVTVRRVRFSGANYREFLRDVVRYYDALGYRPIIDTFQR